MKVRLAQGECSGGIAYKGGYKFQLKADYVIETELRPTQECELDYVGIRKSGLLVVRSGYAWDGPSGPTIATKTFMRGSLVHDALYQLIREGTLDISVFRDPADKLLQKICLEDGMFAFRAWYVYHGVRLFGNPSADPANRKPIVFAPFGNACEISPVMMQQE